MTTEKLPQALIKVLKADTESSYRNEARPSA